ncbi:hypothetical protein A0H81_01957 [Grifola frondosa]|uniref:Uncharacterized protein n=1 Tax=Grifola frondosa TaxID=5627 RepID=A0A1C7MKQ8_GRIFR|nr:hypothetical protein A0H81_01957 [Grifola frondosa]
MPRHQRAMASMPKRRVGNPIPAPVPAPAARAPNQLPCLKTLSLAVMMTQNRKPAEPEFSGFSGKRQHSHEVPEPTPKCGRTSRIIAQVANALKKGTANKSAQALRNAARLIPRSIDPFILSLQVFQVGMCPDDYISRSPSPVDEDEDDVIEQEKLCAEKRTEMERQYNMLLTLIPGLKKEIKRLEDDEPDALHTLADFLDDMAHKARSDDVGALRYMVLNYLPKGPKYPPLDTDLKDRRGFENVTTGRLLCPRTHCPTSIRTLIFCASVRDGDTEVTAHDYPSFLYDQEEYDPEEMDKGFLRSALLAMCFKSLFLGPRNAKKRAGEKENGPGKPPLAQKYNITSVTPRHIAYVAVLVRFILNSQAQWAQIDSNFDASEFFHILVGLFEGPSSDPLWSKATIAWWNKEIFNKATLQKGTRENGSHSRKSAHEKLAEQRAARAAALTRTGSSNSAA